ncbi:MAG: hypothetical protein AB1626_02065 [Candidatus Micrarchaeota archaeon]
MSEALAASKKRVRELKRLALPYLKARKKILGGFELVNQRAANRTRLFRLTPWLMNSVHQPLALPAVILGAS